MSTAQDMRDFGQNFFNAANEIEQYLKHAAESDLHAKRYLTDLTNAHAARYVVDAELAKLQTVHAEQRERLRKMREHVRAYETFFQMVGWPILVRTVGV